MPFEVADSLKDKSGGDSKSSGSQNNIPLVFFNDHRALFEDLS